MQLRLVTILIGALDCSVDRFSWLVGTMVRTQRANRYNYAFRNRDAFTSVCTHAHTHAHSFALSPTQSEKCIINRMVVKYNCGDTTRSTTTNILLLNVQITILASLWVSLPWRRWSSVITDGWFCRGEIDDSLGFESVYSCTG